MFNFIILGGFVIAMSLMAFVFDLLSDNKSKKIKKRFENLENERND